MWASKCANLTPMPKSKFYSQRLLLKLVCDHHGKCEEHPHVRADFGRRECMPSGIHDHINNYQVSQHPIIRI